MIVRVDSDIDEIESIIGMLERAKWLLAGLSEECQAETACKALEKAQSIVDEIDWRRARNVVSARDDDDEW